VLAPRDVTAMVQSVYAGLFDGAETTELALDPTRKGHVHLVRG